MRFSGPLAYKENLCDLRVGVAPGNEVENLQLS